MRNEWICAMAILKKTQTGTRWCTIEINNSCAFHKANAFIVTHIQHYHNGLCTYVDYLVTRDGMFYCKMSYDGFVQHDKIKSVNIIENISDILNNLDNYIRDNVI